MHDFMPAESEDSDRSAAMDAIDPDSDGPDVFQPGAMSKRDELHPYTQSLSVKDVESCFRLEEEAFPVEERASKEKVSLFFSLLCSVFVLGCGVQRTPPVALTVWWDAGLLYALAFTSVR